MNKFIISFISVALTACVSGNKNSSKVSFAPKQEQTKVDYYPTATSVNQALSSGVKISVMVPIEFSLANQALTQSKLLQIVSRGGISGVGGSPVIVIAPMFALLSESVTATVPAKSMLKYSLTLYIANIITGDIYATTTMEIVGVGDSSELALQNAISSISTSDTALMAMISQAEQRIIDYYTKNGVRIIAQAQTATANNQYDTAIALLSSIPMECGDLYDKAQKALEPIYVKNVEIYANQALAKMTSALAIPSAESFAEAMTYYQQIPHDDPARAKADVLYSETKTKLTNDQQKELDHAREMSRQEFDKNKEIDLLKLKMNVEGQESLLNKYKKDAAYERLPWIRKVFHFGDWDPFDGSGVSNFDNLNLKNK